MGRPEEQGLCQPAEKLDRLTTTHTKVLRTNPLFFMEANVGVSQHLLDMARMRNHLIFVCRQKDAYIGML